MFVFIWTDVTADIPIQNLFLNILRRPLIQWFCCQCDGQKEEDKNAVYPHSSS